MAMASFTKDIVLKGSELVDKLFDAMPDKNPVRPIDENLTSDKTMERGKELLKQYFSH